MVKESLLDMVIEFGRAKFMQGVHAQEGDARASGDAMTRAVHYFSRINTEIEHMKMDKVLMQSNPPPQQKMQHDPNAGMQLNHGVIEKPVELTAEQREEADRLCRQYLGGDRFWLR